MSEMRSAVPWSRLLPGIEGLPQTAVRDLTLQSQAVTPGAGFVALQGTRTHGLDHAAEALDRGAGAVLWDEGDPTPPPDPRIVHVPGLRRRLPELARTLFGVWPPDRPLVAVTGTDGKTSVSHQISTALTHLGRRCAVIGTLGAGTPGQLTPTAHTTPDVLALHRHLAALAAAGYQAVALEASSHALAQGRLEGVHPRVAVLTHLGRDHLDYHGSLAAYAEAKAALFRRPGLAAWVLNRDDAFGRQLLAEWARGASDPATFDATGPDGTDGAAAPGRPRCWTYSVQEPEAGAAGEHGDVPIQTDHIQARQVRASVHGVEFEVRVGAATGRVQAPLIGVFQVSNLLATLATLLALGYPVAAGIAALGQVRGVPGRMERFARAGGPLLVVDYAHTPRALESALQALRPHAEGRVAVVFGCGGNRDVGKRPLMGGVASRLADRVFVTDDNPRDEAPEAIRRAILAGCDGPARVREIGDRAEAIAEAVREARAGDVVLIAGKGHETTQLIRGVEHPFSDREHAATHTADESMADESMTDGPMTGGEAGR